MQDDTTRVNSQYLSVAVIKGILVDAMAASTPARVTIRTGIQLDSLKLASQLTILKLLHRTALSLDERLRDTSSGRNEIGLEGERVCKVQCVIIQIFKDKILLEL